MELSAENLRLQEEAAVKDSRNKALEGRVKELEAEVEGEQKRQRAADDAIISAKVQRGEDIGDLAEAIRSVESVKQVYEGLLDRRAYEHVIELLDAKKTLLVIEGAIKAIEAASTGLADQLKGQFKEAVAPEISMVGSNLGAVATILQTLVNQLAERERRDEEIRELRRKAYTALINYIEAHS